jgi:ABC-type uncharacterized transport system involved in gliding motility auxiliary subunit
VNVKKLFLESLQTKEVRYGGYAAVLTLAIIIGLVLLNLIVQQFSPQVDLTQNKLFSLSEQTLKVLEEIKSPVTIYGLWEPGKETKQVKEVLDKYTERNKNIRLEVVDPDKNPGFVAKYDKEKKGIEKGALIVEGEKGFKLIPQIDLYEINWMNFQNPQITGFSIEKRVTGALLYVTSGVTPVIYDVIGHREKPLFDLQLKPIIERENFTYRQLNLLQSDVPEDAGLLVINTPKQDLSPGEADRIRSYLEKGGRLLVMADFQSSELPNLKNLLASYGVAFDFGVVVEMNKNFNMGNPFHVIPELTLHDIVRPLKENNQPVVLQFAQGIKTLDLKRRSVEVEPLLTSSKDSFLRVDLNNNSPTLTDSDKKGPITLAVAVREPLENQEGKETRLVLIGSGTLLEPLGLFGQIQGNFDLFMNSITWLQDRPETLSVRSKSLITLPMNLSALQVIIFGVLFTAVIPLALFGAGLAVWLKRRHL